MFFQLIFTSFSTLQSGVWSTLCLISHLGMKAQVYVVCDKTKLVGVLFERRSQVILTSLLGIFCREIIKTHR